MCAPLLSKYELHPADRLIHHRGEGEGGGGGGGGVMVVVAAAAAAVEGY